MIDADTTRDPERPRACFHFQESGQERSSCKTTKHVRQPPHACRSHELTATKVMEAQSKMAHRLFALGLQAFRNSFRNYYRMADYAISNSLPDQ